MEARKNLQTRLVNLETQYKVVEKKISKLFTNHDQKIDGNRI